MTGWDLRILGTDLNEQILDRARSGRYSQTEVNRGIPDNYLNRYFFRAGNDWQVKDVLRQITSFEQFDLRKSMANFASFDLILCRNVLIYLDLATKKKILAELRRKLSPDGFLVLGCAETIMNIDELFTKRVIGRAIFYQAPLAPKPA